MPFTFYILNFIHKYWKVNILVRDDGTAITDYIMATNFHTQPNEWTFIPSLHVNFQKIDPYNSFVRMLSCSPMVTNEVQNKLLFNISFRRCRSITICLEQSCCTKLCIASMVDL